MNVGQLLAKLMEEKSGHDMRVTIGGAIYEIDAIDDIGLDYLVLSTGRCVEEAEEEGEE